MLQLTTQLALAQPPDQLLSGRVVDTFGDGSRVELRQQPDCVCVERRAIDDVRSQQPVHRIVEVVLGQLGEQRLQALVREHAGESVALELRARVEHAL